MLATLLRLILLLVLVGGAAAWGGERWPGFRGPQTDGHSDARDLPLTWSETENVVWKTPIHGKAWSSPVVWDGQIWLTTAPPDGKQLFVLCVDLASGKIVREIKLWDIEKPQYCIEKNSYATPTPVIEEGRIYVHFGAHGTACVDTKTGQKLWERQDLPCNHHRGPASSPIVWEDLLILTFDGFDLQYVVALNKKDGTTAWRSDRKIQYGSDNGDIMKAYCTPIVIQAAGKLQLIAPSAGAHIAYNPRTGEEIWRVKCGGMNVSSPPIFAHGQLYLTTAAGGFNLFAVRPDGEGDITGTHLQWKCSKAVAKKSAPILVGDLLYMSTDEGILSCVDALSGEPVWQHRVRGEYSASPIYADGRIYFFGENGESPVLEPGREPKILTTNKLDDGCMASPAVVGRSLIVRTKTHLYRIEKKP